jgi:Domain of unknown function (DUF4279)
MRRLKVALRITGEGLDVAWVTDLLGVPPSRSPRESALSRRGDTWLLTLDAPDDTPLENQIGSLLGMVSDDPEVWEQITRRYDACVFCGAFLGDADNELLTLGGPMVRRLAALGLSVALDVYAR